MVPAYLFAVSYTPCNYTQTYENVPVTTRINLLPHYYMMAICVVVVVVVCRCCSYSFSPRSVFLFLQRLIKDRYRCNNHAGYLIRDSCERI